MLGLTTPTPRTCSRASPLAQLTPMAGSHRRCRTATRRRHFQEDGAVATRPLSLAWASVDAGGSEDAERLDPHDLAAHRPSPFRWRVSRNVLRTRLSPCAEGR